MNLKNVELKSTHIIGDIGTLIKDKQKLISINLWIAFISGLNSLKQSVEKVEPLLLNKAVVKEKAIASLPAFPSISDYEELYNCEVSE